MKTTTQEPTGPSFFGMLIQATVAQLRQVLGEPVFSDNDGTDKVNFEWNLETDEGDIFTVYDWKEYAPLEENELIDWHIGGKSFEVTDAACKEIKSALNN